MDSMEHDGQVPLAPVCYAVVIVFQFLKSNVFFLNVWHMLVFLPIPSFHSPPYA